MMLAKSEVRPNIPRDGRHCDLCGCSQPAVRCDKCGCQIFCLSCDDMYHRHPKRRFHLRKAVDPTPPTPQARPVLPMKIAHMPTSPVDPSKMPLPPPRKKKPGKSFFDTFRRRSPSSDNSPPLPKKEYSWTDRLGNIKKFMSNRPLPPLPNTNGAADNNLNENNSTAKHDLSFIHKKVDERPPQLPQRSLKPAEFTRGKENLPHGIPGHNVEEVRNGNVDHGQATRNGGFSPVEDIQWDTRTLDNHQLNTLNRQMQPDFMQHGGGPGYPGNLVNSMHQSASATDLQKLTGHPGQGIPPQHYPHYPMNPHMPPHAYPMPPHPYPMYPPPQFANYPQYFGNSFANLASQTTTTDGDFSDHSEASPRHHSGRKYPFRKRAKRSQSVMMDRMAYPGQFYPFGPFPPGYGPGPWAPPFPIEAPPSPASSVRSLNRIGRTRRRKKVTSEDDDEEFSMSSSPLSRPKSSSSERPPPIQKIAPLVTQTTSSEESEAEYERERSRSRNEKNTRKISDTKRMPSPLPQSPHTSHKKIPKQKKRETLKRSEVENVLPTATDDRHFGDPGPSSSSKPNKTDQEEAQNSHSKVNRRPSRESNEDDQSNQEQGTSVFIPATYWQCKHCTYINQAGSRICQVCCKTATAEGTTLVTSRPNSASSRKQSLSSEKSCSSPEKKMDEEEDASAKRDKQDMAVLNSALDEAEKEISRGLEELMKLKEDFSQENPRTQSSPQSKETPSPKPDTNKPVYKSTGKMRTSILDKLVLPVNKQSSKTTSSTSTETQTSQTVNDNPKTDRILQARRPSTPSTTSDAYNSPTAQSPEFDRMDTPNKQAGAINKPNTSKEMSCQTQTDDLLDYLERKKVEEDSFFGRPNNGYGFRYGDRMDSVTSPVPPMFDRGYGMMQRSHSRASLFTGRLNDFSPLEYGLGPTPMYRSVSRSSLTGDYPESRFSEFHNLRKPDYYLSMEELVERRRQESIRVQGLELVRMIREAEQQGFTADDIQVALNNCGKQNPLEWLQENWKIVVENVINLSTSYANDKKENDVGTISEIEAREALRMHKGNIWAAVTECVESRQRKFLELRARGKFKCKEITDALTSSQGDVEMSHAKLTRSVSKPFLMRIWGAGEGAQNQDGAIPKTSENVRYFPDNYLKHEDDVQSDELWDDEEEDVDWDEDLDEQDDEEQGDLDLQTCREDLFIPNGVKTPESEGSDYCEAFGSNTLERNLSSPSSDTFYVIPDTKQEKKNTGFLSKLAALRKEDKAARQSQINLHIDVPATPKELQKEHSLQDVSSLVSDQQKTYNPLSMIKNTISAIRESVGGSSKTEKKFPCSSPERRTIIVSGKIPYESLSDDGSSQGVKLMSAKPLEDCVAVDKTKELENTIATSEQENGDFENNQKIPIKNVFENDAKKIEQIKHCNQKADVTIEKSTSNKVVSPSGNVTPTLPNTTDNISRPNSTKTLTNGSEIGELKEFANTGAVPKKIYNSIESKEPVKKAIEKDIQVEHKVTEKIKGSNPNVYFSEEKNQLNETTSSLGKTTPSLSNASGEMSKPIGNNSSKTQMNSNFKVSENNEVAQKDKTITEHSKTEKEKSSNLKESKTAELQSFSEHRQAETITKNDNIEVNNTKQNTMVPQFSEHEAVSSSVKKAKTPLNIKMENIMSVSINDADDNEVKSESKKYISLGKDANSLMDGDDKKVKNKIQEDINLEKGINATSLSETQIVSFENQPGVEGKKTEALSKNATGYSILESNTIHFSDIQESSNIDKSELHTDYYKGETLNNGNKTEEDFKNLETVKPPSNKFNVIKKSKKKTSGTNKNKDIRSNENQHAVTNDNYIQSPDMSSKLVDSVNDKEIQSAIGVLQENKLEESHGSMNISTDHPGGSKLSLERNEIISDSSQMSDINQLSSPRSSEDPLSYVSGTKYITIDESNDNLSDGKEKLIDKLSDASSESSVQEPKMNIIALSNEPTTPSEIEESALESKSYFTKIAEIKCPEKDSGKPISLKDRGQLSSSIDSSEISCEVKKKLQSGVKENQNNVSAVDPKDDIEFSKESNATVSDITSSSYNFASEKSSDAIENQNENLTVVINDNKSAVDVDKSLDGKSPKNIISTDRTLAQIAKTTIVDFTKSQSSAAGIPPPTIQNPPIVHEVISTQQSETELLPSNEVVPLSKAETNFRISIGANGSSVEEKKIIDTTQNTASAEISKDFAQNLETKYSNFKTEVKNEIATIVSADIKTNIDPIISATPTSKAVEGLSAESINQRNSLAEEASPPLAEQLPIKYIASSSNAISIYSETTLDVMEQTSASTVSPIEGLPKTTSESTIKHFRVSFKDIDDGSTVPPKATNQFGIETPSQIASIEDNDQPSVHDHSPGKDESDKESESPGDSRRNSVTPPSPVDALRSRFEGLMDDNLPGGTGPIRPQSPFRRMSFRSTKAAIALERTRDSSTEKPWFVPKPIPEPKKPLPKRSLKQQMEIERRVRKMVADRKCRTYRKAEIVIQLVDMNFEEDESIQAANECATLEQAISFLQQECLLCTGHFPVSHIISMVHCPHEACRECIRAYFTVQIRDRNIMELLCPFCNEPDIFDEDIAQDYFNHLDIMLKKLVDSEIHELFQRKLRDRVLMRDPNFKWCSQCSSGFISMPNLKRLICPDCNAVTCASCRRLWERDHQGISCEAFAALKDSSDSEAQAVGLAKLLTEDGIDCPRCHFRYALAKGGCMHFRCIQCQHDFCSGCTRPFKMGQKCGVSEFCAKLGLHAHHPRNCLFYLRDKEPEDLQRLLEMNDLKYDRDPPDEVVEEKASCQVMEQKETTEGMVDDYCGKDIEDNMAGLCRIHYVEYLGQLVNKNKVDPIQIFGNDDLELVLRRANIRLPPKRYRETDESYREKLVNLIQEELPLDKMDGS